MGSRRGAEPGDRSVRVPRHRLSITLVLVAIGVSVAIAGQLHSGPNTAPEAPVAANGTPLDLTRPFTGTPAANWPDGVAGLEPPAAAPVGGHPAAEVAAALDQAQRALIAAHLDDRMLVNHDPSAYLALLAPNARGREQATLSGPAVARDGGEATMIQSGFTLLPIPVKVNGSMSVSTGPDDQLVVHANYVFAYPFAPEVSGAITEPWQIVAIQHVNEEFTWVAGAGYARADHGLWPTSSQSYYESMACGPAARGYLAPEYSQPYAGSPQTVNPDAFYDPGHPISITTTCGS